LQSLARRLAPQKYISRPERSVGELSKARYLYPSFFCLCSPHLRGHKTDLAWQPVPYPEAIEALLISITCSACSAARASWEPWDGSPWPWGSPPAPRFAEILAYDDMRVQYPFSGIVPGRNRVETSAGSAYTLVLYYARTATIGPSNSQEKSTTSRHFYHRCVL
jgi:hypothetical protein